METCTFASEIVSSLVGTTTRFIVYQYHNRRRLFRLWRGGRATLFTQTDNLLQKDMSRGYHTCEETNPVMDPGRNAEAGRQPASGVCLPEVTRPSHQRLMRTSRLMGLRSQEAL